MKILFEVPGEAVGKGRPRFARQGAFVRAYSPEKTVSYENKIKAAARIAMNGAEPFVEAMQCTIFISATPAQSWSKKKQQEAIAQVLKPTKKPDLDNIGKIYLDALNGIAWIDDKQVVKLSIEKQYGKSDFVSVEIGPA